jgi:very-short-patch-repair endonuclease
MCALPAAIRTFADLRAGGMSRRRLEAGVRTGRVTLVRRGVYASGGACQVAILAASHGGALACVSAARHSGIWVLEDPDVVHVWLPAHGLEYDHDGCVCVAHWDEGPRRTDAFGLPSIPRMLRQILRCRGLEQFFVALESALNQTLIDDAGLDWLRRHTNAAAREAIAYAHADAQSGLESLLRWRLRSHGLPVRSQVRIVSVGTVDFLIGRRLIVEVDGTQNHATAEHRHRDLRRDANAAAWGYVTLRFDYAMVVHDWGSVELAILACVDREREGDRLRRP